MGRPIKTKRYLVEDKYTVVVSREVLTGNVPGVTIGCYFGEELYLLEYEAGSSELADKHYKSITVKNIVEYFDALYDVVIGDDPTKPDRMTDDDR